MMLCAYCDKPFTAKRSTAKFCSNNCRVQFHDKDLPQLQSAEELHARAVKVKDEMNEILKAQGLPLLVLGSELPPLEFVSSGIKEVDALTKGFPRKRVTEIFGLKGVGKTTLMTRIIQALPDLKILYFDAEGGLPSAPDNIQIITEHVLERVVAVMEGALDKNLYDLIVVDSIASLVPRAEIEGEAGDAVMGLKARLMSQWMRRINFHLSKSNTAVVFINQQRESMNPYGPMRFTPGGHAVPYAASLRLELKSNKADKFEGGHWVNVEIEKSRICKPYQKTKFKLLYS